MKARTYSLSDRGALKWWHGWAPVVLLPGAVLLFAPASWPRWVLMWTLAFTIYCGCKWLTWRRTPLDDVPGWRHAAYLLAWPGLDPAAFLHAPVGSPPSAKEWARGVGNLLIGIALFFLYWVYGGYVVISIVAFALLSIVNARELAGGSGLARGVCCYIAIFWGIRVALQGVFDVKEHLTAWWLKAGYFILTVLFATFTFVYAWAALGVVN